MPAAAGLPAHLTVDCIAAGLDLMVDPPLANARYERLGHVFRDVRILRLPLVLNGVGGLRRIVGIP